jgi:hypothetical protein
MCSQPCILNALFGAEVFTNPNRLTIRASELSYVGHIRTLRSYLSLRIILLIAHMGYAFIEDDDNQDLLYW